jgi:uncharacterized protein YbjT (DUF2867 family)
MILITGATSENSSEIIRRLSAANARVRAMVRSRSKAGVIEGLPGVEIVEGDLRDADAIARALDGVERALLLSSGDPSLIELQHNFIAVAKRSKVRHVVKFSGVMPTGMSSLFRFARWHAEIERLLEDSGLPFTHLRPTQFMRIYLRFQPTIVSESKFYAPMDDARVSPVDSQDIAAVAAAVLTEPGHEGKGYVISGPEALSFDEIADKLSRAVGRKITYVNVTPEQMESLGLAAGRPGWFVDSQSELWAEFRRGSGSEITDVVRRIGKKEPVTFDDFATKNVTAFRGGR